MSNKENIAAGVFELRAEAGQFSAVVGNATEIAQRFERIVFDSFNKAGKAASDTSAVESSAKRYVSALEREALALERKTVALVSTLAEQRRAEAAGRGQSAEAEAAIAKIDRAEKSYKSLTDTLQHVKDINVFGEMLAKSQALGQVEKNIDSLTAALDRLQVEAREAGAVQLAAARVSEDRTREAADAAVFGTRVAEAQKLARAAEYVQFWNSALDQMEAKEREVKEMTAFENRRQEAVKLNQAAEYVQFWNSALDQMEAKEREVKEMTAFENRRQEAVKLNQAAEYVQFWNSALDQMEAKEREVKEMTAFENRRQEAVKLNQAAEYVQFWNSALDQMEAKERELAALPLFEKEKAAAEKLRRAADATAAFTQLLDQLEAEEKKLAADTSFIDSLQRRANAINKTQSELLELEAAQRGLTAQAAPHIAALRAQEKALGIYSAGARDARVQTNQMRTALSQLPMQFTDIFTSLAGGQNPLLVLIQQGGQIKDSFGGIGNAIRDIGGAIKAAFTPVTVAVGATITAVGALGHALIAGEKETAAYRRALVLTGNAAGTTTGQLQATAEAVSRAVGTQGKAAETIAALAATGRVAGRDLGLLAEAAIRLEREGGPAVKDTVAAFAELGKSPTQGALKLNETTRFLTVSVLEQIKALEEQGKVAEAARVAMTAYAEVGIKRSKELESQLGFIEKKLRDIVDGAKAVGDAFLNIGRPDTSQSLFERTTLELQRLRDAAGGPTGVPRDPSEGTASALRAKQLREILDGLSRVAYEESKVAIGAKGVDDAYIKAAASVEEWGKKALSTAQQVEAAQKKLRREIEIVNTKRVADGLQPMSKAEIQKLEQTLIESFNKGNKAIKERDSVLEAAREEAKRWADEIAGFQKIGADATATTEHLTKAEKLLIEALENPAWVTRTAEQQKLTIAEYLAAKAKEDLAASTKAAEKALQDYTKAVIANAAAMASDEAKVEADLQRLRDEYVELTAGKEALEAQAIARLELAAAMKEQAAAQALIDGASDSALVADSLQRQAQALRDQIAQRGLNQGARRNNELAEENRKAAEDAAQEWTRTVDGIRDGLTDAFRRAFESGEDFGTAMAKVIERELKARIATALPGMLADGVMALGALAVEAAGGANGSAPMTSWISRAKDASTLYDWGTKAYNWYTGAGSVSATYGTSATISGTVAQSSATKAALYGNMGYTGVAEGTAATSTGAAGSSSGSWGAAAGYAAIIAAAIIASDKAYDRGFTGSDQLSGKLWYEASLENATRSVLSKLGVNDKWAEILSGSVALNDSFGYSQARVEAAGVQGTLGAGDFTGQSFADIKSKAGWVRKLFGSDDRTSTEFAALPAELGNFLDAAAKSVFDQAKEFGEALGLPAEALSGITTDIKVTLTDDIEANKAEIAKALGTYGDALVGAWADAVTPLAAYGETTAQTVQRVGGAIVGVNAVLDTLGIAALQASVDGGKAALALQSLFGGQQGLEQATGSYLQNYYDEAERSNLALAGIGKTLGEVGLTVPKTKEEFRALVEAQNLMQPAGQAAFAALMKVEGAFASVTASSDAASAALQDAIAAALPKFGRGAGPYGQIQQDLSTAGVSVSVDYLKGLNTKDAIYAAADAFARFSDASDAAKTAVVKAASALADLRDEADAAATDLQIELLRAQGDELGAVTLERERELAALRELDPALASVKQLIYDAIDAAAEAARVSDLLGNLDGVIADFLSGSDLASYWATRVQQALAAGGIDADLGGILGSTTADIRQLWDAVGIDGKEAILEAYGAWQSMREAILEADIADIVGPLGTTADELLEAYAELTPATDNLVTSWRNTKAEVELLGDALAEIDGTAAVSAIDALRGLISQRDGLAGVISNNEDQIFNLRVGQGGQSAIDLLRQREASLWTQFASTNNPEIARAITETTLQRIALESELQGDANAAQIDALKEQISAAERLRDLAAQMGTFILGLQAGSLSNLGYAGRLAASEQLFSNSLTTGMDVQGNAQSYLQSAQGIYGGATGAYSDIFESVTGRLRGIMGVDYEGQISEAQAQLQELEGINASANAQIAALTELNGKFGVGLDSLNMQVATQTQAVRDQIVELKTLQTNQERQILQFGEALDKLITAGGRTADAVEELVDAGGMAGAEP